MIINDQRSDGSVRPVSAGCYRDILVGLTKWLGIVPWITESN